MKPQTNSGEHSAFSKAFMLWCMGSGFVLAGLLLAVLIVYALSPYPIIMKGVGGRVVSFVYWATLPGLFYSFWLFVVSVVFALIAVLKHRRGKAGWIYYSLIVLTFVLSGFACLFLMMLQGVANWYYVEIYYNVAFLSCMFFIMSVSSLWFLVWMILLYRKGRMKYWSIKAFLCRWTGFVLAAVPIMLIMAIGR